MDYIEDMRSVLGDLSKFTFRSTEKDRTVQIEKLTDSEENHGRNQVWTDTINRDDYSDTIRTAILDMINLPHRMIAIRLSGFLEPVRLAT